MTQEEKQLLLRDLCARLPYGVKFNYGGYSGCDYKVELMTSTIVNDFPIEDCKPYLRPMDSMTKEERKEYFLTWKYEPLLRQVKTPVTESDDWLEAHHFDYRGLIEKELALEAPEDMYKTE